MILTHMHCFCAFLRIYTLEVTFCNALFHTKFSGLDLDSTVLISGCAGKN